MSAQGPQAEQAAAAAAAAAAETPREDGDAGVEEESAEVFASYQCTSMAKELGKEHPGEIAESGLLSSVSLPSLTYPADALSEMAREGTLSSLQLEGILFACQAHQHILPGGRRKGFFLGDGAGVGKGRQIAGIIFDNFVRNRRKAVWLSLSSDLKVDAERDLRDIKCHVNVIDGCRALDEGKSKGLGMGSSMRSGVVFTTYSTLISGSGRGGGGVAFAPQSRIQQIIDWCGGQDFDGPLIFDEAHKAKNFNSEKEESSTRVSQCVIAIQEAMPRARVVYASATGVTDVSNLAYCDRLGLWGLGTPFPSFSRFKASMEKRGIGALEMLAMELKGAGVYVSRGLSWKGAEFEIDQCALSESDVSKFDEACAFWRELREELENAERLTGCTARCSQKVCPIESTEKGKSPRQTHFCSAMTPYWGALQRFFKEVANAAKVPFVVEQAKEALSEGRSVVIGLQSTGEAGLDRAMEDQGKRPGDNVPRLVSAAYYQLRHFISERFPTRTRPEKVTVMSPEDIDDALLNMKKMLYARGEGASAASILDAQRMILLRRREEQMQEAQRLAQSDVVQECVEAKNRLLSRLDSLTFPPSPLDSIIDLLGGPGEVAEMTGRKSRIARAPDGGLRYEMRVKQSNSSSEASINVAERKSFMDGKKRVAIISDAASTGVSLHAACGSPASHRRRVHITLELAWSADKTIQQLGRSHRSHQQSAPIYRLLVTDLGGERRFASAVSKRLQSLGALTKGDRRAASGCDFSAFDIDNKYGKSALRAILDASQPPKGLPLRFAKGITASQLPIPPDLVGVGLGALEEALLRHIEASVASLAMSEESKRSNVGMFLNRIQALPVHRQNLLFAYFSASLLNFETEARASGTYDAGVADLRAASIYMTGPPEEVATDPTSGTKTVITQIELDRGVNWDQAHLKLQLALEELERGGASKETGFYVSHHRDIRTQRPLVLLAVPRVSNALRFVVTRPSTGTSPFEMDRDELLRKYNPVNIADPSTLDWLKQEWSDCYRASDGYFSGSRKVAMTFVAGAVLPIWPALESAVSHAGSSLTRAEQALRAYRVPIDDGSKVIGIRFPSGMVGIFKGALRDLIAARKASGNAESVMEAPSPVDSKALKLATTPKNTILTFFGKRPREQEVDNGDPEKRSSALSCHADQGPSAARQKLDAKGATAKSVGSGSFMRSFLSKGTVKSVRERSTEREVVDVDAELDIIDITENSLDGIPAGASSTPSPPLVMIDLT